MCSSDLLGKDALNVPWKMFPDMELNLDFVDHVSGAVPGKKIGRASCRERV